jgi:hypothetical protein
MPAPAKKTGTKKPGLERSGQSHPDDAQRTDSDLEAFRVMSRISRQTTAKELDELIRAAD